jgi:hypothetical protein
MNTNISTIILGLVSVLILFESCNKDKKDSLDSFNSINSKYFVNEGKARAIAAEFNFFKVPDPKSRKIIESVDVLNDAMNKPAYYVIHYNEGFLLLSADERQEAVLGFSDQDVFNTKDIPVQLDAIIKEEMSEIDYLRSNNIDSVSNHASETWLRLSRPFVSGNVATGNKMTTTGCYSWTNYYGTLVQTKWAQMGGTGMYKYNDSCPSLPCGKAVTGCVATAMGQLMAFYKWPASYSWNSMANANSKPECARLLRDAGIAVNMGYNCTGSGADALNVAPAMKTIFNYTTAAIYTYSLSQMIPELLTNHPVLLSGRGASGGHMWVCDGYAVVQSLCFTIDYYEHMNWGWGGAGNGYYTDGSWNPGNLTFNDSRRMIFVRK